MKIVFVIISKIMVINLFLLLLWGCSSQKIVRETPTIDLTKAQASLVSKYGNDAMPSFIAWQSMMNAIVDKSEYDKIKRVNEFINRRILWGDDQSIWGQVDFWATPMDTLGKGAGDCEDFVIIKYYTLISLRIQIPKLRLVYVEAKNANVITGGNQAHMVLAYYASPDAEPMIMDNLITEIRPVSRRPDLVPLFSFNSEGVFLGTQVKAGFAENARLSKWQDLIKRAKAEGF